MTTKHAICRHAQLRRKEMGLTEDQVRLAVDEPDMVYPASHRHPGDRTCYQRGNIVVVFDNEREQIVTVLWHGKEGRGG